MTVSILNIISPGLVDYVDLKPIKPGETIEYRLTRAGMVDPSSTRKVATPQYQGLAPYCNIRDPFDQHKVHEKTIMNIVGYDPVQSKPGEATYMNPRVDYARFLDTGSIVCTDTMNNLHYYLALHNYNRDNPNRKTDAKILFYRVDVKKEIKSKINGFDYRVLASNLLFQAEEDRIFEIAVKVLRAHPQFTFDVKEDVEKLKANLAFVAENNSLDFIMAVKEPQSQARVMADDLIGRKLIFFDDHEDKLEWKWRRSAGQKGKHGIVKLEKGNNPIRALVEFLTTAEGNEHLVEIKELYEERYATKTR